MCNGGNLRVCSGKDHSLVLSKFGAFAFDPCAGEGFSIEETVRASPVSDIMLKQTVESVSGRPAEIASWQQTFAVVGIDNRAKSVLFVVCKVAFIHIAIWPLLTADTVLAISDPLPIIRGTIRMSIFASEVL